MEKVIEICSKYGISYYYKKQKCHATGIGDILFHLCCLNNNLLNEPFYINLNLFTKPYYGTDPIIQLEFRLELINDIIKYNTNIKKDDIHFIFSDIYGNEEYLPYHLIDDFKLNIDLNDDYLPEKYKNSEYIIFHTKCRHLSSEDYCALKLKIDSFCEQNTCKYNIIIMGERTFPYTEEVRAHGITTIYKELSKLKKHNNVEDITIENIYNNLDYNSYKKDVLLIKNAKYNICFGLGGQLCTSILFGKSTLVYCKVLQFLNTENFNKKNYYSVDIDSFLSFIKTQCF